MRLIGNSQKVRSVRAELPGSRKKVADLLVTNGRGATGASPPSWGQYLDDGDEMQVGLFGTCAAIEVLAKEGGDYAKLAKRVAKELPDLDDSSNPGKSRVFDATLQKGDLGVTYKLCARAEAVDPGATAVNAPNPVFDALVGGASPEAGWADYRSPSPLLQFGSLPNVAATGSALYALRRYPNFVGSGTYAEKQVWLAQNCSNSSEAPTFELALTLLALEGSESSSSLVINKVNEVRRELGRRMRLQSRGGSNLTHESHEYVAPLSPVAAEPVSAPPVDADPDAAIPQIQTRPTYRYMFYLPDVLAAFALLGGRKRIPFRVRPALFNVVETCRQALVNGGRVVGTGRQHASVVDHLWVYRLLTAYEHAEEKRVRSIPVGRVIAVLLGAAAVSAIGVWLAGWKGFLGSLAAEFLMAAGFYLWAQR